MFEFYTAEHTSFRARLSRGCFAHAVGDKVEAGRTTKRTQSARGVRCEPMSASRGKADITI
jgi:hypothetical protein